MAGGIFCRRRLEPAPTQGRENDKSRIKVERQPGDERLQEMGVNHWPIWTKEASEFPWTYDESETCYFLEGEVTVTGSDGETARVGRGDLVTFPAGLSCKWKISKDVKNHYRLG